MQLRPRLETVLSGFAVVIFTGGCAGDIMGPIHISPQAPGVQVAPLCAENKVSQQGETYLCKTGNGGILQHGSVPEGFSVVED